MEISTKEKGFAGEDIATQFLIDKGYKILKRNFHFGNVAEIDIIAEDKNVLVFVEVKTRYSDEYGDPLESITPSKQRKLRSAANGYLYVNKISNKECRFDVIIIDRRSYEPKINHLQNAF